jgi:outer membrane lipoprotein-sorting protein
MNAALRLTAAGALALPILLTGCSLFPTIRKLPVPKAPTLTQRATPDELVARLNTRWKEMNTLTATVEIQATLTKSKEGTAKDSPTSHGHIWIQKPEMIRVYGTYLGMKAFDMASDGKNFTLSSPLQKKFIKGSNSLKRKSANALENLRPQFFLDALVVRGPDPDELYEATADAPTVEDTARKHLYSVPQYVLNISRRKSGSQQLLPVRRVYFHREDLEPYEQDIYDSEGNLETQVIYDAYQQFDSIMYPSSIVIRHPLDESEEIKIVLTVDDLHENQVFADDLFVVKPAEGAAIQDLE